MSSYRVREARRLRKLLATKLTPAERTEIERQLTDLEKPPRPVQSKKPISPYLLGTWDRQKPAEPKSDAKRDVTPSAPVQAPTQPTDTEHELPAQEPVVVAPPLSAVEVDELVVQVREIADRIMRLRAFWARTLSPEVDREGELWLSRLQELAKKLPSEILELALGERVSLVTQPVRDVSKPQISTKVQQRLIAPSAPNLPQADTWSELYFAIHEPRTPRPRTNPPGYIPDGLQGWVS